MLVAFCLATLVGLIIAMTTMFTARTFEATGNYADLSRASRFALDTMTSDIRQARQLTSYSTNSLVFSDLTNGTFSYTWTPGNATLTRTYNGSSRALLTHCDSCVCHISQRNPSNNFSFYPADTAANAKMIDVTWVCSRALFGKKVNTEAIQTAKFTIRN